MTCVRDRTIAVKLAAERTLMYALQVQNGEKAIRQQLSSLETSMSKSIEDYARRVLSKLADKDSDVEDDFIFA